MKKFAPRIPTFQNDFFIAARIVSIVVDNKLRALFPPPFPINCLLPSSVAVSIRSTDCLCEQ